MPKMPVFIQYTYFIYLKYTAVNFALLTEGRHISYSYMEGQGIYMLVTYSTYINHIKNIL